MRLHDLIFSTAAPERLLRHSLFWTVRFILTFYAIYLSLYLQFETISSSVIIATFPGIFFQLMLEIVCVYSVVFVIFSSKTSNLNRFSKTLLTVSLLLLFIFLFCIGHPGAHNQPAGQSAFLYYWPQIWGYIGYSSPAVCVVFVLVKLLKRNFMQLTEKTELVLANNQAELKLLKAQVHPHFLFNTLNNIYAFALESPVYAAALIGDLRYTFQYLLEETAAEKVPLEKELNMIKRYLQLEETRFGPRLQLTSSFPENNELFIIAPMLLLPLVENSFKHGPANMKGKVWINISLAIRKEQLLITVENSRPKQVQASTDKAGIGLSNLKRRLELIYPGNHSIYFNDKPGSFKVEMTIPLEK